MPPELFFDRAAELHQLEQAWQSPGAQLVTVWGRRRVGKSTLLAHFAAGKRAIYLYGTRIAERDLLTALALQVAGVVGDEYLRAAPFPNWDAALDYLAQHALHERLADPYLRFWFRFVSPFQSLLQLGQGDVVWEREIQPALQEFVARTTWEEACTQHLWRRIAAKSLPAPVAQLGHWWDKRQEIDIVGLWGGRATLVGECKWTGVPVDDAVLMALQVKAQKLPVAATPLWVLASRSGFTPAVQRRAQSDNLLLLEPDDLYSVPL